MKKWIKETFQEFVFLPLQMKVFFVGMCFLIMFSVKILIDHKKRKPSKQVEIQLELKNIQDEKDSINNAFRVNADSAKARVLSKHGIEVL